MITSFYLSVTFNVVGHPENKFASVIAYFIAAIKSRSWGLLIILFEGRHSHTCMYVHVSLKILKR